MQLANTSASDEKVYVDGTDFSLVASGFRIILASAIGKYILRFSILIDALIWIIYAIILIIKKITPE